MDTPYTKRGRALHERFEFRPVRKEETDEAILIEQICFPPNEACTAGQMKERIETAPDLFLAAFDRHDGKMAGFLCGLSTDETVFRDEFFTDASLYDPDGANIMLLGLDVLPGYRNLGLARELMHFYGQKEKANGRRSMILTCHDEKIPMYERMGFSDLGISASVWGGVTWHDMKLDLR